MNMLSSVTPWDMVAEGYSESTMKMFEGYAEQALAMTDLNKNSCILDIACGPGTLSLMAAEKTGTVSCIDFSQAMIDILDKTIKDDGVKNIKTFCGDAQELPYKENSFDAVFSMFGLMFFPDRMKGYKEIHRTLKPGGRTVITSWAPTGQSPLMMTMFNALKVINPDIPEPQTDIASLENPDFFKDEMVRAGFKDVDVVQVTHSLDIESVEEFWDGMVKGSAPIVMMKNNMPDDIWQEKNKSAIDYLRGTLGQLPTSLSADAWFAVGVK